MKGHDSDSGYHPNEREAGKRPRWMTLEKTTLGGEGSVWFNMLPPILEGRSRPDTTFNQPIKTLFHGQKAKGFEELTARGISTVSDVLKMPEEDFSALKNTGSIRARVKDYLDGLAVLPHAKLLEAIFFQKQFPVDPDREQELVDVVETVIPGKLTMTRDPRSFQVLQLHYGLEDGITRTLKETENEINKLYPDSTVGLPRVQQIDAQAMNCLRHPSRSKHLEKFLTLPEQSIARRVLGFTFYGDIPEGLDKAGVLDFDLSDYVLEELRKLGHSDMLLGDSDLFAQGVNIDELSIQAIEELKKGYGLLIKELEEEKAGEPVDVFVALEAEQEPVVNNLLPEIDLTGEQLSFLKNQRFTENNLPERVYRILKRAGITTIGQLLCLKPSDMIEIRNFGRECAKEVGKIIEELLGESEEKIPKDFISELLTTGLFQSNQQERAQKLSPFKSVAQLSLEQKMRDREIRREKNQQLFLEVASIAERARADGCKTLDEIQQWMEKEGINIAGEKHSDGLKTRALIFYVLNNPQSDK